MVVLMFAVGIKKNKKNYKFFSKWIERKILHSVRINL